MNEKNDVRSEDVMEIDLMRLFGAVWKRVWIVAIASVLAAVMTLLVTVFCITPQYQASAMFYVNNSNISLGDASLSISSGDISASKSLVSTYIVILNTRETLNDVIDYAGVSRSYSQVKEMISAESVNSTEIFRVTVTAPDPQEAEKIANAVAYILPKRISTIVEGTSAQIVSSAVVPSRASSPSYTKNTILGFLLGFVLSVGVIALRELFDTTIRTEEDITQTCGYPILAEVPDMAAPGKGGSYYSGGKKDTSRPSSAEPVLIGDGMSFSASEAYKLLRTKLQFSFAGSDSGCRVVGLSSALSGEGKSLTAINLAYTLSQLGKRVLVIDCDMRRPTIAKKLNIERKPGLSDLLTGQAALNGSIQYCGIREDEKAFHVISAGEIPPNPVELLSSQKMHTLLETFRTAYDYVLLDFPPVGEVSDALVASAEMDGILIVTRQNHGNRPALGETIHQIEFVNGKILGVVYNGVSESGGKYGYSKSYYKKYGSKYEKSYEAAMRSQKKQEKQ